MKLNSNVRAAPHQGGCYNKSIQNHSRQEAKSEITTIAASKAFFIQSFN